MPIDIQLLRAEKGGNPEAVRESQRKRGSKVELVDQVIELDSAWRKLIFQVDNLKRETGILSKKVQEIKKKKGDASDVITQVKAVKVQIAETEAKCAATEKERDVLLAQIGNIVPDHVPVSMDEDDNIVERSHGQCRAPTKYHHHELLAMIDGYANEEGVAVAGHRGYFLKGVGVLLNQALINYGLAFLMKHEYTPLQPPFFMKKERMAETAQLEEFDEALYKVVGDGDDKYLIATSEQPISAFHRKKTLQNGEGEGDLPIRYAGYSTCFRKEAGSSGRDCWGIFRIHQFEKIEQFCLTDPENSWKEHDKMIKVAEEFYKNLGLAYRVVNIVSGELNNAAAKKFDLEAWFPTLSCYRELVSSSNCTDYQSRAMETRFGQSVKKAGVKEKAYVHMLNATLCATERTICCILENYQTEEGVLVPEVLQPFMGGMKIMPFKKPCPVNKTKDKQDAQKAKAVKQAAKPAKQPKQAQAKGGSNKKAAPKGSSNKKKAAPKAKPAAKAAAPKPAAKAAAPKPAVKAPAAAAAAGGAVPVEVTEAANKVVALKKSKADVADIKAAVATLLELKAKHGILPPPKTKKNKKKKK